MRQAALIGIWIALRKGVTNSQWLFRMAQHAAIDELRRLTGRGQKMGLVRYSERIEETMNCLRSTAERKVDEIIEAGDERLKLDNVVRAHCCMVLNLCNGNRARASRVLGIGRATFYRWMFPGSEPEQDHDQ